MLRRTRRTAIVTALVTFFGGAAAHAGGEWVNFVDETDTRLSAASGFGSADPEEKDYAWGDFDNDGDVDLVVVRKEPFTSTGRRKNRLFMNEGIADGQTLNGVLVDRTNQFAIDTDDGSQGFRDDTNDRDVVVVDVDNDGWLDLVTATTLTDNSTKTLSHPRVYMNKGEVAGAWQGFRYEEARIPLMHPTAGPRFCSVAAGDLTGDGFADLYFGDYDSGGAQIFDYNNRLLINDGNGFFTDQTGSLLTSTMSNSAFGAASVIADMNQDGVLDIVKQTSLNTPTHVAVTYNNPSNEGTFNLYDTVYGNSPYFVSAGDLNGDGMLDLVVTDDGVDRYMLNTGNGGDGAANFSVHTFPTSSNAFGSNSVIADLNKDGLDDVLIADVDVDIAGCNRRTLIYRNLGGSPPQFAEQGQVIPNAMLAGTHDIAVFDLNGDTWLDLVIGRCTGTEIWINQPPTGLVYGYPLGLPSFVAPDQAADFEIELSVLGGGAVVPGSATIHTAVGSGPFASAPLTLVSGDTYSATLPAAPCTEQVRFYVSAELSTGGTFTDPPAAPATDYVAIAAEGTEISLRDEIEGDVSGWSVVNDASLTSGAWEAVDPDGTIDGGTLAAPEDDATQGAANVKAFVTENGPAGGSETANDIDGGPTWLVSPVIDLAGTDATVSFARWFYSDTGDDQLVVEVTTDGSTWTPVPALATSGTGGSWETAAFVVGDYLVPTATVQVRFGAADAPNNSVAEAGIDNFQIERFLCGETTCTGDLNDDGSVGFGDLNQMLAAWGLCLGCPEDLDATDSVGFSDLNLLLGAWGACP